MKIAIFIDRDEYESYNEEAKLNGYGDSIGEYLINKLNEDEAILNAEINITVPMKEQVKTILQNLK